MAGRAFDLSPACGWAFRQGQLTATEAANPSDAIGLIWYPLLLTSGPSLLPYRESNKQDFKEERIFPRALGINRRPRHGIQTVTESFVLRPNQRETLCLLAHLRQVEIGRAHV